METAEDVMTAIDETVGETYLDVKFAELRRAALTTAAATIFAAEIAKEPMHVDDVRRAELKARAAADTVELYYKV
jgi:hypothetical protein